MFASVGADGSVRMFDLRHLEHSTIIYEDPQHHPLLRLAWNKQDPNYLATMAMDALEVGSSLNYIYYRVPTSQDSIPYFQLSSRHGIGILLDISQ